MTQVAEMDRLNNATVSLSKAKKPTAEQALILEAGKKLMIGKGFRALIIEAGAGTGKTTTDRMLADVLDGNGQYTAFNTALVKDSESKFFGTRVSCNTTHSLAFRAVGKRYASRLNGKRVKSYEIAQMLGIKDLTIETEPAKRATKDDKAQPTGTKKEAKEKRLPAGFLAGQVVGAIKRFCQSADKQIEASHFRYIDGLDSHSEGVRSYTNNEKVRAYLLPFALKAWADIQDPKGQLPFSHDYYVKIWQLDKPVIAGDFILLDEAQDTAPVMLDILKQQQVPVILVGDTAQQIYEWRGATNALAAFPGAPVLYLSQSFRFGEAIAEVANAVLSTLDEPVTLRLKGLESIPSVVAAVADPTCVLCRTNAVAVGTLLEAIAKGKRPYLVGGGSDVVSFVEAAADLQAGRTTSHPDLACFSDWKEVQEYVKEDEGEDLKLMVKLVDTFGTETIANALKGMPEEEGADLVICTAHKSKGREWDKVQLANDFPTKSKCTDSDRRLLYVAVTRAKLELDLTRCPFFTGQDSMDLSEIRTRYMEAKDSQPESIVPPAPSTPPAKVSFTWAKDRDGNWAVRGPKGYSGESVTVSRKDGSSARRRLGVVLSESGDFAIYKV